MKKLIHIILLIGLIGHLQPSFAQTENLQIRQRYDPNGKCLKVAIKDNIFTIEKIILQEQHYTIKKVKDIIDVKEKLSKIFDESYLSAIIFPDEHMVLKHDAVPIAALGPFFNNIAIDLERNTPLLKKQKIIRIEFITKDNTLTQKILYASHSKKNDKEEIRTFYFYKARNEGNNKSLSPNIAMIIPQKQLYQIYLNLLSERDRVSYSSNQMFFTTTTPIDQEIVFDDDRYHLERLDFTPLEFTSKEQEKILTFVTGWKQIYLDNNGSGKYLLSDFHQHLKMTFSSTDRFLKSGLIKKAVVTTSKNIISSYMLDLQGKETKMSFYCYKAISKTQKDKSIFIAFPYNFEEGLKEN